MRMEYYFRYREINDEDGSFYETDVEFPTLMKKHIQKHGTALQPIYEAISNSFEATKDENDSITIAMNFSRSGAGDVRDLLSISVIDTGHGITSNDLTRLKRFVMSIGFFDRHHSVLWMGKPEETDEGTPTGTTVTFSLIRDEKDKKE